jgi:hypothetical protein
MISAVNRPTALARGAARPHAGVAAVGLGARRVVRVQALPDPSRVGVCFRWGGGREGGHALDVMRADVMCANAFPVCCHLTKKILCLCAERRGFW